MSPKYRVLLAVLLTLLAICSQAVFGQTKIVQKIVHINQQTVNVSLDKLTPKDCQAGAGSITITVTGGSGKYTYNWSGPAGFTSNLEDLTNLNSGTYTLQLKDGGDCIYTRSWEVQSTCAATCQLLDIATVTQSKTCSSSDGSIKVTINGGSGSYSYLWYNKNFNIVGNTKDLAGVAPGTYYLEVTDLKNTGCTTMFYYYIESALKVSYTSTSNSKCASPFTGGISAIVTGGSGNYSYQWQYPDGTKVTNTAASITGLRGGNYILTVKDKTQDCTVDQYIYLSNTSAATLAIAEKITPSTHCAPGNGSIDITVSNGSGNYTYTWYNQSTGTFASSTEDITNVTASTYSAYVLDNTSGCSANKQFVVADRTQVPSFTFTKTDNTLCSTPFNGAIDLNPGASNDYTIRWSNGVTTEDIAGLSPGNYGVSVTDKSTGCVATIDASGNQAIIIADKSEQPLSVTIDATTNNTHCIAPSGSIQTTIASPAAPVTITWTGPDGYTANLEDINSLTGGDYILTASIQCNTAPVIDTKEIVIQTRSAIELDLLTIITDRDNNLDPSGITIIKMPKSGAVASITADYKLNIQYKESFSGIDNLTIQACDLMKACSENIITIDVKSLSEMNQKSQIVVYNAVAPKSIGDNRFMRIEYLPPVDNRVSIFNRWGDKVFEVQNYTNDLPGKRFEGMNDHGKDLPSGTYFYKIEFADASSPVTGYLSLKQ
ncbi:MAG TPA: gliding motility-associated C-terminal domain-containing protein [Ohtaekwangia sp.]|uniref:T9SS type B sorting domain-containing protein n=1 Tax=Ohtaekwangia sp. TaxID=2066019 RepID=UPI002F95FB1A